MTNLDDFDPADEEQPKLTPLPAQQRPVNAASRTMPNSKESEDALLACCLIDDGVTLDRALAAGITAGSFYYPAAQEIFHALTQLRAGHKPITSETLIIELKQAKLLDQCGGFTYLLGLQAETTTHAGYMIESVATLARKRDLIRAATELAEKAYNGAELSELEVFARHALKSKEKGPSATPRPVTEFRYPTEDDPNIILGSDDYLGRGGGLLFISHAGAGKSSWIMDACMMWALGQAWMGIKCGGKPRKSLIIQAEDSDRYIGKIFASFAHANKLTEAQLALLTANCIIVRLKGVSGPSFFTELRALTEKHKPDLVIINPIYLYALGDITRSEFTQPFLVALDEANKEEKFAYILIHHTGKPQAKGKDGKRAELEDWESAYMGFGSSYLANWPRCTALLEPVAGATGRYTIKLGKGGLNAGVTKEVPQGVGTRTEPCTRISIKHSTDRMDVHGLSKPVYYWEIDNDSPQLEQAKKGGKEKVFHFAMFTSFFPHTEATAMPLNALFRYAKEKQDIGETTFRDIIRSAVDTGDLACIKKGPGFAYYLKQPGV